MVIPTSCFRARNSRGSASSTSTSAVARDSGGPSAVIIKILIGSRNVQRPAFNVQRRNDSELWLASSSVFFLLMILILTVILDSAAQQIRSKSSLLRSTLDVER